MRTRVISLSKQRDWLLTNCFSLLLFPIKSDALRQATSSRSPLAELVADPILLRSLAARPQRPSKTRSASSRRSDDGGKRRERGRVRESDTASHILSVVLAEEEREVQTLRSQLIVLGEQLKSANRRATDAELRAQTAETRAREAQARMIQAEHAKHLLELEAIRQNEEIRRIKSQAETFEREVRKLEFDVRKAERERSNAEEKESEARDALRIYTQFIHDENAREEGLMEGRRLGLRRGYSNGRLRGFQEGRKDGFEEGYSYGRQDGWAAGETDGRRVERIRALNAFDKYVASNEQYEYNDEGDVDSVSF